MPRRMVSTAVAMLPYPVSTSNSIPGWSESSSGKSCRPLSPPRGVRLTLDQTVNTVWDIAAGVDVKSNTWDAIMYSGMDLTKVGSFLWPDVERDRVGVFAETFHRIRENMRLGGGVRYDRVEMDATGLMRHSP
ncbi:TonB-dependent receptor [Marinobacter sp.]